jgi:hypothetical protein
VELGFLSLLIQQYNSVTSQYALNFPMFVETILDDDYMDDQPIRILDAFIIPSSLS